MGDRTAFTFTVDGLDSLSVNRKHKLARLLGEISEGYLVDFPQSGFDTEPTDRWSNDTWVWTEILCGTVNEIGVSGFTRVIEKLRKWGLDPDGAKIWEDPKYEWLGDMIRYTGGRYLQPQCDSDGNALLVETQIPESAMLSHEALGRFVADHFGFTVAAPWPHTVNAHGEETAS